MTRSQFTRSLARFFPTLLLLLSCRLAGGGSAPASASAAGAAVASAHWRVAIVCVCAVACGKLHCAAELRRLGDSQAHKLQPASLAAAAVSARSRLCRNWLGVAAFAAAAAAAAANCVTNRNHLTHLRLHTRSLLPQSQFQTSFGWEKLQPDRPLRISLSLSASGGPQHTGERAGSHRLARCKRVPRRQLRAGGS